MKKFALFLAVFAALALMAGAALAADVKVMSKGGVGDYLTDSEGMTLYWFKKDSPGESACNDTCVENWPLFYIEGIEVPAGLDAYDFETITRNDGEEQTTFRGYPLYYFIGDENPGDTNGDGKGGVWYVVDPNTFAQEKAPGYGK